MEHADSYEVLAVRYGTRVARRSDYYLGYGAYGEPDAQVRMDYFFWVLRSERETVLVDTGFDPRAGVARGRTCLVPPAEAMEAVGASPPRVSRIVLTHLHYDHIGNLHLFPSAQLLLSPRELELWGSPIAERLQFATHLEADDLANVRRAADEGRVHYLPDDSEPIPGVRILWVGGHSPGQLLLVVRTKSGPVVVASDTTHFYEEMDRDWPCSIVVDLPQLYRGYDTLRTLVAQEGARLLPGHDPQVLSRFPRAEGSLGEFVACLR